MLQTRLRALSAARSLRRLPQRRYDSSKDGSKGNSSPNNDLNDSPQARLHDFVKAPPQAHAWHSNIPHQSEDETQEEYHPPDLKPQEPATHPPTESFNVCSSSISSPAVIPSHAEL